MSWKTTNNRNKTTATDVIRCDELITDDIIAENATLNKKITVRRNITLRDLSITDISIATIIAVPDVSVNRIGENIAGGMIEFISPFSAPAAEITSIFANDSSISQLSTHDLSVDIIKSTGNNIHFHNADVSFNGNVKAHDVCFNELFTLDAHEFNFLSDISTNDAIYVSDISVDIVRGPIKIEFDDISLHNVQHASDVSLANNLDVSLLELMNMGSISGARLTIHPDVSFHDISALGLSVDVITMVSVTGDVSVNGDLSINGEIKAGGLKAQGEIVVTEDASFENLHGNDVSVNNIYGTYLLSDTSLVIHGDISINNMNELKIPMDPRDINQLKKKPLSAKKEFAKDTFGIITENDLYEGVIFRNNTGNFSTVKMDDLNVNSLTISQLMLTDGSFNNGFFSTTDVSSHTLSGDLSGFSGGFVIGDHGYLVPDSSSVMVRFGLSNEDNVATDISLIDFGDLSGFSGGFSKGNFGYLVPDASTTLVRYDAINDDVSKIELAGDLSGFRGGFAGSDNSGYLVPFLGNKVVSFPLTANSFALEYVEDISLTDASIDFSGFYGGFSSNNNIFLAPKSHSNLVKIKEDEFVNTGDLSLIDLSFSKSDPELTGFKGGFAHDNSGYLIPGENGKVVEFSTSDFSANNVNVIDFSYLTGDASLVEFSGGFKDGTHGYLIPETFNKVARFDLATARIITSLDISVNGKDVSGFSGGFISGDYGYLIPNKSNELVRFSTNQNNTIINSDDDFILDTFKSNDTITIDKNRAYNLRIDFSYLIALDPDDIPYEDVSMMVEIKPFSDISYFYNYDNSGSAGPGASEDISNVVRITDLSYSEAFNFTFARKSDSAISMLVTLRDNCNNDTAGNALSKLIKFDVVESNVAEEGNFDTTYDLALRDRNDLSFINNDIDNTANITVIQRRNLYNYFLSNGIKLFDKVLIEQLLLSFPPPSPDLFEFTSHTFTNATSVGTDPPTLLDLQAAYNGTTWASEPSFLNVDPNYNAQKFTIPQSGLYRIQARGAAGGPISGQSPLGVEPGRGYDHKADFSLTRGEHLYIIVGQMGQTVVRTSSQAGPGGGGSFVFTESSGIETLLMAGAGGNGGSWEHHRVRDPDGRAPGDPDPAAADGKGRGSNGGSWQDDGVNGDGGAPNYGQAQGIGIGGGSDAKGANYLLNANSNQQNFGNASVNSNTGGGFGGGGTATPYEGGGGGGYIGGFAKKTNSHNSRHLDYGALSYVQSSATNKINVGLGPDATHGQIILTKLSIILTKLSS